MHLWDKSCLYILFLKHSSCKNSAEKQYKMKAFSIFYRVNQNMKECKVLCMHYCDNIEQIPVRN